MTDKAAILISDFQQHSWKTENLYKRLFELASNPIDAFSFAVQYLESFDKNATIFNDILSYITKEQFAEVVQLALDILKTKQNENAESVIEYASLQFPELLHDNIELIFKLKPNERTYYANYPWRNLNTDKMYPFV